MRIQRREQPAALVGGEQVEGWTADCASRGSWPARAQSPGGL